MRAVLIATLFACSAASAAVAPETACPTAKLRATAREVSRLLGCHRRAALSTGPVDQSCLDKARGKFSAAFARAEGGGCAVTGDADAVQAKVDAFVGQVLSAAGHEGGRCTAATLRAVSTDAGTLFRAYVSEEKRQDYVALTSGRSRGSSLLASLLTRAPCSTAPDADALGGAATAFAENLAAALGCGDGIRGLAEACDGADDDACPGHCGADCRCPLATAFACLAGSGPLVTLSGTRATPYENPALATDTRIDARSATLLASPSDLYPLNLGGGDGVCVAGATVNGQYDRSATWQTMHDQNNAGVRFENARLTVDGVRIDNVTDGIRPVVGPFTIRQAWLSYVRDDCVENDHQQGGLIEDVLFDGCYVAISERPSPEITHADGRHDILTIRDSLIRLQPMLGPYGGAASGLGNGQFFKWDERATALAVHDTMLMAEQVGQGGASTMGMPASLVSCSNNVMVWLGPGSYPAPLPACFTVTRDRAVWDDAVTGWKQRHPEIGP